MSIYETAEDAYFARAGTVSTNGIAAAVDAVVPLTRQQIAEEIAQAIEHERTVLYGQRLQDPRQCVGLTRAADVARRIGGAS